MSNRQETTTNYDGLWGRQIKAEAERKRRLKEPTPRPWKWWPKEGQFIVDADRNIVAEIPCQGANPADGKLIVDAVNERDAVIAGRDRLRAALGLAEAAMAASISYVPTDLEISLRERVKIARAALSECATDS